MYREVTTNEIKKVLRLWLVAMRKKRIAAQLSLDPKTVRRRMAHARAMGAANGSDITRNQTGMKGGDWSPTNEGSDVAPEPRRVSGAGFASDERSERAAELASAR